MEQKMSLSEAFNQAPYTMPGHGKRNIEVLKEVFEQMDGTLASDIYGSGQVIEEFQAEMAQILGKARAVFFPSGTMAQQIALRIWCDRKGVKRVAYHPLCHLEIHEQDGLKELHGIQPVLLADRDALITLEDVQGITEELSCLLLELPQREIGGQLPDYEELVAISEYCRGKGIALHLDGARLFEILPYYRKTAAEVCALFDSVYISFYKGIGGIAGAILAGPEDFTEASKIWKRRHGGDLISLYPYILSSSYYFKRRADRMGQYYEEAKELVGRYNRCSLVTTLPVQPVSNMFHVHIALPKTVIEPILAEVSAATEIGITSYVREVDECSAYYEVSIGDQYGQIPKDRLDALFVLLNERLERVSS